VEIPTAAWVAQQLREAFPFDSAPRLRVVSIELQVNQDLRSARAIAWLFEGTPHPHGRLWPRWIRIIGADDARAWFTRCTCQVHGI